MRNVLARIAGRAVERPTPVIVAAVLLTLIGAVAALRLEADRSPDSLVDRGSATYAATQSFYDQFGDEPVEVLVKGDLRQLLLDAQPRAPAGAGELPLGQGAGRTGGQRPAGPGAVRGDRAARPERRRLRPGDLPQPVRDPGEQAARAGVAGGDRAGAQPRGGRPLSRRRSRACRPARSRQAAASRRASRCSRSSSSRSCKLGAPVRQNGPAAAGRPELRLVGDLRPASRGCAPKARLAAIVPSSHAALISVRLRPGLSDAQRSEAISLFREAVADPTFRLHRGRSFGAPSRATWSAASRWSSTGLRRSSRRRSSSCSRRPWRSW